MLSLPCMVNQWIYDLEAKRMVKVRTSSYFDWATLYEVFARQDYLPPNSSFGIQLQTIYEDLLKQGLKPLILDLGANIGASAVLFSLRFPMARIVCVEPDSGNFRLLEANTSWNPEVVPIRSAVSRADGEIGLYQTAGSANNAFQTFSSDDTTFVESVPCVSPETLLERHSETQPFLLKVDIEGHESTVFQPPVNWVNKFNGVMSEIHDWMLPGAASSNSLLRAILDSERDIVLSGENLLCVSIPSQKSAKLDSTGS